MFYGAIVKTPPSVALDNGSETQFTGNEQRYTRVTCARPTVLAGNRCKCDRDGRWAGRVPVGCYLLDFKCRWSAQEPYSDKSQIKVFQKKRPRYLNPKKVNGKIIKSGCARRLEPREYGDSIGNRSWRYESAAVENPILQGAGAGGPTSGPRFDLSKSKISNGRVNFCISLNKGSYHTNR
ncbi:hypothetical protein EVAR_33215_1 [Eumeta japonica]|uniref:Uncharacterized protein n=1 Tax=Eumeta variegata TaxID=151549 RepID=A0A4C1W2M5_EUMVA|nr:hypothetical protein EVAR_33215_1 [Eumeta japonica]